MRPQKVDDLALLEGLMSVLRSKGYDGSSLNELASSSGLKKASLYHRFPGGKKEITRAVLNYVYEWVDKNIYKMLSDKSVDPNERLGKAIDNIDQLYYGGNEICILRALSMDSGIELFGAEIKDSINSWIDGFTALGIDFGLSKQEAETKAYQVLINVQGSLVVSKSLTDNSIFKSALDSIIGIYKK